MREKVLLIDAENVLHQSFHKFEKFKSTDGKPSGAIFGFFKSLHMYMERFYPDHICLAFDNGHSPYRSELLPNYKGHRKNISVDYESLQSQKAVIMKMLKYLRIPFIFDKKKLTGYEGDDFIAWLRYKKYEDRNKYVQTIVSSDKDYNQLISKDVKVFNPRKNEVVTVGNCKQLFGYTNEETVDYLCLVGDSSDDIPGVKGYGPVKTRKFLDKYWGVDEAFKKGECLDIKETYERNKKLIDLSWFINEHPLDEKDLPLHYLSKPINWKKFKEVCIEYSLASFMTDIFMKPFKEYNHE